MKFYEINCLVRPDFENEISEISNKISGFLSQNEAKVEKITEANRIKLGASINKYKEAFMINFFFYVEEEKIDAIRKYVNSLDGILRNFIVVSDPAQLIAPAIEEKVEEVKEYVAQVEEKIKEEVKEEIKEEEPVAEIAPAEEVKHVEEPKKKKAGLEDIDEKLEEMLK